ncbi:MAG: Na+/H+ antiporter subunit C [Myxococcota bacterium]
MEWMLAASVGVVASCGVYLLLRRRSMSVVFGLALLSYATNLVLFSMGRLTVGAPPILGPEGESAVYADPLPQALVLTAIVIGFAMTAFVVVVALIAHRSLGDDDVDAPVAQEGEP